ncbi:blue-light-activated histidine kinase [Tsuneonella sp. HG249]
MMTRTLDAPTSFVGDDPAAFQDSVIADRRELALVAVERTRMPMVVSDPGQPDAPIVLANQAFLDLTGYSAAEVIGRNCRFLQGPDTAPAAIDAIRQGLAEDRHFIEVELLNYRKDGTTFWNQLSISPVHDGDGKTIYYFGSQKDVTARRRAEELEAIERLLLMEVDHRAMNALALVQSILSLTQATDVSSYSEAIRRRIEAVARVHRILARSSWKGSRLVELIVEGEADRRMNLAGPPVKVSPRLAQPIALVMHELVSNAKQHGALLRRDGAIDIGWETVPDGLTISWHEEIGSIAAEPKPGLGLSLVKAIVERQLGGHADLAWQNETFDARLQVPTRPGEVVSAV